MKQVLPIIPLHALQDSASKSGDKISTKWYIQTISNRMPSDHVVDTLAVALDRRGLPSIVNRYHMN